MKKNEGWNDLKHPVVKVNKALNQYEGQVLFPAQVDKANEALRTVGLPKSAKKSGSDQ